MLPTTNAASTSHRTQNKVERELKRADKEYSKAEKGFQKGSIRRAEKHENRGMAHELRADGLTVGSRHGHNEATRVAMLHNSQLNAAQPTIMPVAGPAIIPASSGMMPGQGLGLASTGFEQQGQRGFIGQDPYLQQQSLATQSSFGPQSSYGTQGSSFSGQDSYAQQSLGSGIGGQQGFAPQSSSLAGQQNSSGHLMVPHGPGMTTTVTSHQNPQQRF